MRKIINILFQPFMNFAIQFGYAKNIGENKHQQILKLINRTISSSDAKWLPTSLAYYILVAIVPVLSLALLVLNLFNGWTPFITKLISDLIPDSEEVVEVILGFVGSGVNWTTLVLVIVYSIWYATRSTVAINDMATYLYGLSKNTKVTNKKKYFRALLSLGLIIGFAVGLSFGVVFLPQFLKSEAFKSVINIPGVLISLIHFFVTMIILYIVILVFYTAVPNKKMKFSQARPGALFFSITLAFSMMMLSISLSIGLFDYSGIFGSVAIIILLGLMSLALSYIFFVGMVINVSIEQATKLSATNKKATFSHRIARTFKLFKDQYKSSKFNIKRNKPIDINATDGIYSVKLNSKKRKKED